MLIDEFMNEFRIVYDGLMVMEVITGTDRTKWFGLENLDSSLVTINYYQPSLSNH